MPSIPFVRAAKMIARGTWSFCTDRPLVVSFELTHSCTAALEMAAMLAQLQPGDEVITTTHTFIATVEAVTGHPINSRYQFGGGFLGDYTALAAGSDERFHAFWTDTNNVQNVVWWFGTEFSGLRTNQQDVVTRSGIF